MLAATIVLVCYPAAPPFVLVWLAHLIRLWGGGVGKGQVFSLASLRKRAFHEDSWAWRAIWS